MDRLKEFIDNIDKSLSKSSDSKLIIKTLNTNEIKEEDTEEDTMIIKNCVFSTEDVDGDGEIIRQDGWKLDRFIKNPVLIPQHRAGNIEAPAVGKVLNIAVKDKKLVGDVQFAPTDVGKTYYQLYKGGFMSGFSVGYRAIKKATMDENSSPYWGPFEYLQQELTEISCVSIPCNPNAVTGIKSLIGEEMYKTLIKDSVVQNNSNQLINMKELADSIASTVLKGLLVLKEEPAKQDEQQEETDKQKEHQEEQANQKEQQEETAKQKEKKLSFEEFLEKEEVQEYAKSIQNELTDEQLVNKLAKVYIIYEKEYDSENGGK